jgi:hypothetical protein
VFDDLLPNLQPFARALHDLAAQAGVAPRVTSTRRSHAQQKKLYENYLAGRSQLPALPPGKSKHEYGMAFDLVTTPFEALWDLGQVWGQWGGIWGAERDPVHFELPDPLPAVEISSGSLWAKRMAQAVDFIIGLNPAIGAAELAGMLLQWGFPDSEVAAFLAGPAEYLQIHGL